MTGKMLDRWTSRAFFALLSAAVLLLSGSASALTLADLDGGASFTSLDGSLLFDNFSVGLDPSYDGSPNALAGLDLSIFQVETFDEAFGFQVMELNGPISAVIGQVGRMLIEFDVSAASGFEIVSVGLNFTAGVGGAEARAGVTETVVGGAGTVVLQVLREGQGQQIASDSALLAPGESQLRVSKDIVVDARGGVLAQISQIEQSFQLASAVPEPGGAALFGFGALVIGAGLRRGRRGLSRPA